jgi:CHAD domain-containing protein
MAYSYYINNNAVKNENELVKWLQTSFNIIQESRQKGIFYYYDTFDWRLYRNRYHLYLCNQFLFLFHFSKKSIEIKEKFQHPFTEILTTHNGDIFTKISQTVDNRALICRAKLHISSQSFRMLNKNEKTIARVNVQYCKIKDKTHYKNIGLFFEICPLRGYANHVSGILEKLPTGDLTVCKDDLLKRGLKTISRVPADYSSKFNIKLTNRMSTIDALKCIHLNLLEIMRINENGIIRDIDIEFLHDFRVAVRRTRSAFGQIRGILDDKMVLKTKEFFSFLGKSTNRLRDIDVYLLREQQYKLMVPVELKQYLNPFFKELREKRKTEHQLLTKLITSAKYQRILSNWESYLKTKQNNYLPKVKTVKELARDVIETRNKKVMRLGQKILLTESDDLLHQLRIEGKKLRYLLEFFQSLFSQEKIQKLINRLKMLQDHLGDLNDLIVQQERLIDFAREIYPATRLEKNIALTMGILIGKLNEKQLTIKMKFAKIYSDYAAPDVQKIFEEIN